jgi:hypothetical protein
MGENKRTTYRISEAARDLVISAEWLRVGERRGFFPPLFATAMATATTSRKISSACAAGQAGEASTALRPSMDKMTHVAIIYLQELRPSPTKLRMGRVARDASCSLEPFEGLFEVGDHIPSVLDTHREPHEVLPDPEPIPPRR